MARYDMDKLRYWVEAGVNIPKRKIFLDGYMDDKRLGELVRAVQEMADINRDPIDLYINSGGGDVSPGLALYDLLESLTDIVIRTHAVGLVGSMAFILFLVGDERRASKRVRFMHHKGYCQLPEGTEDQIHSEANEVSHMEATCNEIVKEKTTKDLKWWNAQIKSVNMWFGKEEAIKYGVVTHED